MSISTNSSKVWRVVQLDSATLPIPLLPFVFPHQLICFETTTPCQIMDRVREADIIITNKVPLDAATIAATPDLCMVGVPAVGLDHLDAEALAARQIPVYNAAGYASNGVAEHALMMMLVLRRRLREYALAAGDGSWSRSPLFCHFGSFFDDLSGQTLGIVGRGSISSALARMAEGLSMRVIYAERPNATRLRDDYMPFDKVLHHADVLSLHCPLTPDTAGIINDNTLAWMKPSAILINTGRGGLIDEAALLAALKDRTIAAAGLDVLAQEPPAVDHPLLQYAGDNLLVTPHSAWLGQATLHRLVKILCDKVNAGIDGLTV